MADVAFSKLHSDFDTALGGSTKGVKEVVGTVTGETSYTSDGGAFTAAAIDSRATELVALVVCGPTTSGDYLYRWDGSTSTPKLKAYNVSDTSEVTAATDLDAEAAYFKALLK